MCGRQEVLLQRWALALQVSETQKILCWLLVLFLLFLHGLLSSRSHHRVFEAWFLLVQCVHWVQLTAQLLVTSETQDCGPLLWLFTFYYHPTNRGHHRALQLVR